MSDIKKVVLPSSGSLDTAVIVRRHFFIRARIKSLFFKYIEKINDYYEVMEIDEYTKFTV